MTTQVKSTRANRTIAENRKARHDFFIEETYEAGVALTGTEIKSVRAGKVNLRDSYAQVKNGELWILNVHIAPYDQAGYATHDPMRPRKLLLHRKEINRLAGAITEKGLSLVPLRVYLKHNRAMFELALARGKKLYDKRDAMAERDAKREVERALRDRERA
jgi:SsrA-binding protein